jgi:hypothetical protein
VWVGVQPTASDMGPAELVLAAGNLEDELADDMAESPAPTKRARPSRLIMDTPTPSPVQNKANGVCRNTPAATDEANVAVTAPARRKAAR